MEPGAGSPSLPALFFCAPSEYNTRFIRKREEIRMKIADIFDIPAPEQRIPVPYVIAEAGVNHEGSMDIARRLIDEAALGGADAIKFQTYKAGTLASKHSPA